MKLLNNLLTSLLVGTGIALALLAAFELALKVVPAGQGYFLSEGGEVQRAIRLPLFPPHTQYVSRPPREYLEARTEGLEARDYVVETDADGFIKPGRIHKNPDLTIAFLGGSTTENFLVPAEARLERNFKNLWNGHSRSSARQPRNIRPSEAHRCCTG